MFTVSKITFELGMKFFPQALFLCSMFHNSASEMVLHTARDLHFVANWRFVILNNILLKIPKIKNKNSEVERERRRREESGLTQPGFVSNLNNVQPC